MFALRRTASLVKTRVAVRRMGGGHDHHGPSMPPMARMRPPTKTVESPPSLPSLL